MDNIDVIYMDDDFNFDDSINNTVDRVDYSKKEEIPEKIDIIDIEEPKIVKPKLSSHDMLTETYNIIDKYNGMKNNLKTCSNELNLLKIKYETLQTEYNSIVKKYQKEIDNNKANNKEIKMVRQDLIESNKNLLMLKTLLDMIIQKYGIRSVCRTTKLTEEQINKYLK